MDFYSEIILDHYKNPRNMGELEKPTHAAVMVNSLCGDGVKVQLKIKKSKLKVIKDIRFVSTGCAVSIAAMSMLSERLKGRKAGEVERMGEIEIQKVLGIELTPTRMKCAMLGLSAVKKALRLGFE